MDTPIKRSQIVGLSLPEVLAGAAGLAAVVASLAGFIPGLYRDPGVVIAQTHGYDVGNLIAAAIFGLGLIWSSRGSARGRLVAIGALTCLVYSYVTYAFLIVLNPVTLLYIAVLGLAAWSVVAGLLRFDWSEVVDPKRPRLLRRATAAFMLAVVVVFAANWLRQIGASVMSGRLPTDLVANGWPMNPVWVEDLGFVLPLIGLGGVLLLMERHNGVLIAMAMLVFQPLLSVTLFSMSVSMAIAGQPLDPMLLGIFGTIAVVSVALALTWLLSPSLRSAGQSHLGPQSLRPHRTT
jgi:hypothetical protein